MKKVQRTDSKREKLWAIAKFLYYFLALPCLLILAVITVIISTSNSFRYTLYSTDYVLLIILWLLILIPLGVRFQGKITRRHKIDKMVIMLSSPDRFSPQHEVLDAGRGKYLGIDTQRGTLLYIDMVKKGVIDVIGLTMSDWTNRELEGSALRLYTRLPDVPVLSVYAHPSVAKTLFDTLGAMSHNHYSEPFPQEPWPLHVGIQSRFVEFEHDVVVPQAV